MGKAERPTERRRSTGSPAPRRRCTSRRSGSRTSASRAEGPVRRLLGVFLLAAGGCSGFAAPTPDDFRRLRLDPDARHPEAVRYRIRLSVDSAWLAGEFDGVVLAREGPSPRARV